MAGAPESLHVWLENREMFAMGSIYCGSRVCKKENMPENAKFVSLEASSASRSWKRFVISTEAEPSGEIWLRTKSKFR
jgi:hypothetical protein